MKKFISIVAAASAIAMGTSAPATAQNVNGWHWLTDQHQALQIAVGSGGQYIIGKQSAGNGNYFVESRYSYNSWSRIANGAGRSIAVGGQNEPWVVTNADLVWKFTNGAWVPMPNGNCEGGTLSVSKTLRNNNIAVGSADHAFVVATDGADAGGTNIRRFTGSCWEIMPGGGKGVEIAMADLSDKPWIRTAVNGLWAFNGTGWTQHTTAVASSVGHGSVVGADGTQIWNCSMGPPQSCSQNTTWSFGSISAMADGGAVIGPSDNVYLFLFGN